MTQAAIDAIRTALARRDVSAALAGADAALAETTLTSAQRARILQLRARAHELGGETALAVADMEGAIALAPADAALYADLGIARADADDAKGAVDAFRRSTELDPSNARGFNNLGNAWRTVGRDDLAVQAFARAVALDANYALAWANLGAVQREQGDVTAADQSLSRALALDPKQRVALLALAGLRRQEGDVDAAVALYERALRQSIDANTQFQLGSTLTERDDLQRAREVFGAALAREPRMLRAALGRELVLPMIPASAQAIDAIRERFIGGLARLEEELPARAATIAPDQALDELRWSNFLLAYHGRDDREVQQRYSRLATDVVARRAPQWLAPQTRRGDRRDRLRVGFLSAYFRDGTVGRYFERWITDLPRDRFEVFVYCLQPVHDGLTARLAQRADQMREVPRWQTSQLAPRLAQDELDVLLYPELGMDATTFSLALLRLAPVQGAAWGHPVTTGHAMIDVFFSTDAMEPDGAEAHYSERLVRLPGIGTRYARPVAPREVHRRDLGLPEGVPLLLCPQSLFKLHPDNDALFARVLAVASRACLVVFEGRHPALTAAYLARLDSALRAHGISRRERVRVLTQCSHETYLQINRACDAMLDTLHWSGGNTSLDALACGLPVVTLPGEFMRGRQSAGMLSLIGMDELVARDVDDYVRIATRLCADASWRGHLRERIAGGSDRLFDDPRPLAALATELERLA